MSFAAAGVAAAADATTTPVEGKTGVRADHGKDVVYPLFSKTGHFEGAARITLTIGDKTVDAYCIDLHTQLKRDTYQETKWDSSKVNNLGKVQWILVNSFPNVTPEAVLAKAKVTPTGGDAELPVYAATQAAIWHFSDGFDLGDFKGGDGAATYPMVQGVYDYLVNNAVDTEEPAPTLSITPPEATGELGSKLGPYTVNSSSKATLTAKGGTIVDANGAPLTESVEGGTKFWLTSDTAGKVTVDASATGLVPTGRVFTYKGGQDKAQKVILAGKVPTSLVAHASGTFLPKAAPAPATPSLPVTGASAVGAAVGGVALLLGGGVLVVLLRRRRVKFTA
nr:thioester domain-containing protein [Planosporangium thailandense]